MGTTLWFLSYRKESEFLFEAGGNWKLLSAFDLSQGESLRQPRKHQHNQSESSLIWDFRSRKT